MSNHVEYHVAHAGKGEHRKTVLMELTRSAERGPVTGSRILAEVYDEADAQRIAASLASLARLPLEALTAKSLGDAYAELSHQRDVLQLAAGKLRAALEKISANAAENPEWIRAVADEAIAAAGGEA